MGVYMLLSVRLFVGLIWSPPVWMTIHHNHLTLNSWPQNVVPGYQTQREDYKPFQPGSEQLKRRWKKYWVLWRKKYAMREKKREVEFRQKMIAKVNEAKKFDAEKYVDEYLEDMKYKLVPKTYKGRRLPQFLIEELLEKDA